MLFITVIYPFNTSAQNSSVFIWTSVEDAFLHTPLTGAMVRLLESDSTTVINKSVRVNNMENQAGEITEAQIMLRVETGKKYLLHAKLLGYDDAWLSIDSLENNEKGLYKLEPLRLRKTLSAKLDEVTVTATKVKMFYKGDTFDPVP